MPIKCPKCGEEKMHYSGWEKIARCEACGNVIQGDEAEKLEWRAAHETSKKQEKWTEEFDKDEEYQKKYGKTKKEYDESSLKDKLGFKWGAAKEAAKEKVVGTLKSAPKTVATETLSWVGRQGKEARDVGTSAAKEFILGLFAGPGFIFNIWLFLVILFQIAPTFFPMIDTLSAGTGKSLNTASYYTQFIFPYYRRINEQWLNFNSWSLYMVVAAIIWPFVSLTQLFANRMTQNTEVPIASNIFYKTSSATRSINRATLYGSLALLSVAGLMQGTVWAAENVLGIKYCPPEVPGCPSGDESGTKIGDIASLEIDDTNLMKSSVKELGTLYATIKLSNKNSQDGPPIEGVRLKLYQVDSNGNATGPIFEPLYICNDVSPCTIEPQNYVEPMVQISGLTLQHPEKNDWEVKRMVLEVSYKLKVESSKQYYIYRSDKDITEKSPEHIRGPGPIDLKLLLYPNEYPLKFEKGGVSIPNDIPILMRLELLNNNYYGEAVINEFTIKETGTEQYFPQPSTCDNNYSIVGSNGDFTVSGPPITLEENRDEQGPSILRKSRKIITCQFSPPAQFVDMSRIMIKFSSSVMYDFTEKHDTVTYVYK
jgi:transcription initiation factor TFIIIB Brf1 subunit/transcription initiation factor TFIIB